MTQPQRPVWFQALPHQQQFQHRFFCSKGQSPARGHRGESGDAKNAAGFAAYDGGVGYGSAWIVRFAHGRFWAFDEEMPVEDEDLGWWLLLLLLLCLGVPELEDFDLCFDDDGWPWLPCLDEEPLADPDAMTVASAQ